LSSVEIVNLEEWMADELETIELTCFPTAGMPVTKYVDRVVAGELHDSTLSFQLANGFEVRGLLEDYIEDEAHDGWAALIVWENPACQESAA
jgi:hypothetical protein